jgi:hypothetical protein
VGPQSQSGSFTSVGIGNPNSPAYTPITIPTKLSPVYHIRVSSDNNFCEA